MIEESSQKFRVLSLDGGGARGILTAQILVNIENYLNELNNQDLAIGQRFDLLVGTSTGGIIALALALGKSASEILEFYRKNIPLIFSLSSKRGPIKKIWQPIYDNSNLIKAARVFFDDSRLEDVITDICVTSVSLHNAEPRLHKSDYAIRFNERGKEKISDIALATSAAPTYFQAHSCEYSTNLIDGGIFANNPAMVALVETAQFERPSKRGIDAPKSRKQIIEDDLIMLSVGTGSPSVMPYNVDDLSNGGLLRWAKPISEVLMTSQSVAIESQMYFLLQEQYHRINPKLKFKMELDDITKIDELKNLADITKETEQFIQRHLQY